MAVAHTHINENENRNETKENENAVERKSNSVQDISTTIRGDTDDSNESNTNDEVIRALADEDNDNPSGNTEGKRVSSRKNKGVISRMAIDMKGKDYRSYTSKQMTQVLKE